jgi:hypothetical protein
MNLIRTILILLAVYFLFKLVFRILLPYLLKNYINKTVRNAQEDFINRNGTEKHDNKKVTIDHNTGKVKKTGEIDAEDVDYEEIK